MQDCAVAIPSVANIESGPDVRRRAVGGAMVLFSATIFLGSGLLFRELVGQPGWRSPEFKETRVWTDDYSNILKAFVK